MGYKINLGEWNDIFAVPKSVAEKYIKLANGDYIKVLLVLLSGAGKNISGEEISNLSGVQIENVKDAVLFWKQHGILSDFEDALIPSFEKHTESKETVINKVTQEKADKEINVSENVSIRTKQPVRLSGYELSKRIDTTEELKWLISEAERLYGRFLTQTETSVLVSMFDYANIPADVIIMVIEYCISIDKKSFRYIESTAYSWVDEGYDDHKKVSKHISDLAEAKNNESQIKTVFGIWDHNLTSAQKKFISVWINEWEFSLELIKIAFERCIDKTGKLSFPYINKILQSWNDENIKTVEDVEKKEQKRKSEQEPNSTFDASDFEDLSSYTVPDLGKKG